MDKFGILWVRNFHFSCWPGEYGVVGLIFQELAFRKLLKYKSLSGFGTLAEHKIHGHSRAISLLGESDLGLQEREHGS